MHVADDLDEMTRATTMVEDGWVPAEPFLLAGQMTTSDPTRSPAGTESFWAYTHVPQRVRGDAGADAITGAWDAGECERFADRVQARLERLAPGFGDRVLGGASSDPTSSRPATPTSWAGASAAAPRACASSWCCGPCRARAGRRPGCGASTSGPPRPTPAAGCTAPPAATRRARPCCTGACRGGPDGTVSPRART